MSYSRWSNSKWYTFYNTDDKFEVCGEAVFTYIQLKERRKTCLALIKKKTDATDEELEELEQYIDWFIQDYESKIYRMEAHSFD